MAKREIVTEWAAAALTVALLGAIPVAVKGYEHHRVAREAAGAQVVELYASSPGGVFTQEPLVGWNASLRHPAKRPIRIRAGVPTLFRITSVDVHHSFSIPELRILPQDVTPGHWTEVRLDRQERGTYTITCYTVCGMKHSAMDAELQAY